MKTCPNCKKEVPDSINVCTNCGTRLSEEKRKTAVKKETSNSFGVSMAALAIISIALLFCVSAVVGMIGYAITFAMCLQELKKDAEFTSGNYMNYTKSCFTKERFVKQEYP